MIAPREFRICLVLGALSWLGAWAVIIGLMGYDSSPTALLYNLPISYVFFVLGWTMVVGLRGRRAPFMIAWAFGLPFLLIRTFTLRIPASGHFGFLPLLILHAHLIGTPRWFRGLCWLVLAEVVVYYFVIWHSWGNGLRGIAVGLALAGVLWALTSSRPLPSSSSPPPPSSDQPPAAP